MSSSISSHFLKFPVHVKMSYARQNMRDAVSESMNLHGAGSSAVPQAGCFQNGKHTYSTRIFPPKLENFKQCREMAQKIRSSGLDC